MCSRFIMICLILALGNSAVAGEIYRCVADNGDVMFTNLTCPAKTRVQHVASYTPVPETPRPTYDASAQAAAASAQQAREAAQQAQAAAQQALINSYQVQAQPQQQNYEEPLELGDFGYGPGFISAYPQFGSGFAGHHRSLRHGEIARINPHAPHLGQVPARGHGAMPGRHR